MTKNEAPQQIDGVLRRADDELMIFSKRRGREVIYASD